MLIYLSYTDYRGVLRGISGQIPLPKIEEEKGTKRGNEEGEKSRMSPHLIFEYASVTPYPLNWPFPLTILEIPSIHTSFPP